MRLRSPVPFQEAFRLNASTPGQVWAVRLLWFFGLIVAIVWSTQFSSVPEHGSLAVTAVAQASNIGPAVADSDEFEP